ncbi:GM17920 [Drosophila sechellia]|uniref:GM17920 n=1 Tax=Drosophila sechellia TaxID=7238 RepID=B4I1Z8_DROSE|nr:GM17920 [Drosophila sechellia]
MGISYASLQKCHCNGVSERENASKEFT